jgi:uncharacterized protein YndB with AHSA1/START domain
VPATSGGPEPRLDSSHLATPGLDITAFIKAPPVTVVRAFFDPQALAAWWRVKHSVTTPRLLGPYAIEWPPTDFRDEILGRLGGVFRGIVMQHHPAQGFFVADAYWLPPDGEPIGPMALHVTVRPDDDGTALRIMQSGYEESDRWQRYYEVIGHGWERALNSLKALLEK